MEIIIQMLSDSSYVTVDAILSVFDIR